MNKVRDKIEDLSIEELKRRFLALGKSVEAMGEAGKGLLGALNPGYLPTEVLLDVTAKTAPFTTAIQAMQDACLGFQQYAALFGIQLQKQNHEANCDSSWGTPAAGKAVQ